MQDKTPQESMAQSLAITVKILREQEQINEELKTQVEQLSILCLAYEDKLPFPSITKEVFQPIIKARKLLTEIKAHAVAEFSEQIIKHFDVCNYNLTRQTLKCYLHDQLHQQAKAGE